MKTTYKTNFIILCLLSLFLFQIPVSIHGATYTPTIIKHIPDTGARVRVYDPQVYYREAYWMDGIDKISVDNEIAFCIEPTTIGTGGTYSKHTDLDPDLITKLSRIVYYGWDTSSKSDKDYALTQYMIWEAVGAHIMEWYGSFGNTYNTLKQNIETKIKNHTKKPSFTNASYKIKAGETLTLEDKNQVLSTFHIKDNTNQNIQIKNNTLIINTDENTPDNLSVCLQKELSKHVGASIIYRSSADDGQDVGVFKVADPIQLTLNIEVEKNGNLKIIKEDEFFNPLSNVTFSLSKNKDMTNPMNTYTTNGDGIIEISDLYPGTYYLQESKTPPYLVIDKTIYPIVIEANKTTTHKIINNYVKGRIQINKRGESIHQFINNQFTFENIGLENAQFEIYQIYEDLDTRQSNKKEIFIEKITTNKDGIAISSPLPMGEYYIKECVAPSGYLKEEKIYPLTIEYSQPNVTVDIVNEPTQITLEFTKRFENSNYNTYDDAYTYSEFEIYAREDLYNQKQEKIVEKNTCIQTIQIPENGNVYIPLKIPYGSYYLKEKCTHPAYQLEEKEYDFIISPTNENQVISISTENGILNCLQKIDLQIKKIDEENKPITNAEFSFSLYADAACKTLLATFDNTDDSILIKDLTQGTYYLKEEKAPYHFQLSNEVLKIEYTENGVFINDKEIEETNNVYLYSFKNRKIPTTFDVTNRSIPYIFIGSGLYLLLKLLKKLGIL